MVSEDIMVPKKVFECLVEDFEHLLEDFEVIAEQKSVKTIERRLKDVKEKKIKGLTEKDFADFLRKEGVNAR